VPQSELASPASVERECRIRLWTREAAAVVVVPA